MNVVLVVIDSLRYDYLAANRDDRVPAGQRPARGGSAPGVRQLTDATSAVGGRAWTPNFDRFAAEAVVFDNSYAASYPTIPHRTDLITGRYGAPFHPWLPLRYDAETLPQALAKHGYATQLIFDTPHLINGGHNFDYPFHAWHFERGNEVDRHWLDDRPCELPPAQHARYTRADGVFYPTAMQYIRNNRRRTREEDWPSPRLFTAASRWLEDNRRRDNFFLWVDCFDPHEPWDPPAHYIELYAPDRPSTGDRNILFGWEGYAGKPLSTEEVARIRAHYAGEVTMVDHWFGRMLDRLEAVGLAERTAVVVTSDHGTNLGAHGLIQKEYPLWDQVAHTVLMVRLPAKRAPDRRGGVRRRELIQPQDIFPTICELAGAPVPGTVQGHSFIPLLSGKGDVAWPRKVVLSSRAYDLSRAEEPVITVQDRTWCLLDSPDAKKRLLYHKPTDPAEEKDVARKHPRVVERLHRALVEELPRRGAPQALIDWFATGRKGLLPPDYRFRDPSLSAYHLYWSGLLPEEPGL
jgi:arylsulfatase A-like enzyme